MEISTIFPLNMNATGCTTSKFQILNCSSAFIITMKLKVKENFHMVAMLIFSFYKNVI